MPREDPAAQRAQLQQQRRRVDFDTYDITVFELIRRLQGGRIEVAPAYQRRFRWDVERQSRLVESLLLGIPVPPLYMATNVSGEAGLSWEVVDGVQRILSLVNFLGDEQTRVAARLDGYERLRLSRLEILDQLDGFSADQLPTDIINSLEDCPLKVVVLSDKSDPRIRFDLFERLNTGGVALTYQEIRESVYMGPFIDLLTELVETGEFNTVVYLSASRRLDGTPQDYVLRFFAFFERYHEFSHSLNEFLNRFCRDALIEPRLDYRRNLFLDTFRFLSEVFPAGLRRTGTTPANLFEGVAVGAALALQSHPELAPPADLSWLDSEELRFLTTGATNSRAKVIGRIEFCLARFLDSR